MTLINFDTQELIHFHNHCLIDPDWPEVSPARYSKGLWHYIEFNHRCNTQLWHEEDLARRRDVPDCEIVVNKRAIDIYNQKRNNAIENIDEWFLNELRNIILKPNAWHNSETAGSIIDRLSILSLKIKHMRIQTERTDVMPEHIDMCQKKLAHLIEQYDDLHDCLQRLVMMAQRGEAYFKIYRQFKMYNDAHLNPYIYAHRPKC